MRGAFARVGVWLTVVAVAIGAQGGANVNPRKPKEPMPERMSFTGNFDTPPKIRFFPRTVFPPYLVAEGARGEVIVAFNIRGDGEVDEVKVAEATDTRFGGPALGTVGRMVFQAATKAGRPVSVRGIVHFVFDYEEADGRAPAK